MRFTQFNPDTKERATITFQHMYTEGKMVSPFHTKKPFQVIFQSNVKITKKGEFKSSALLTDYKKTQKELKQIYQDAKDQNRPLTDQEKAIVKNLEGDLENLAQRLQIAGVPFEEAAKKLGVSVDTLKESLSGNKALVGAGSGYLEARKIQRMSDTDFAKYFGFNLGTFNKNKNRDEILEAMDTGLFAYIAHPDIFMRGYPVFDEHCKTISRKIIEKAKETNTPLEYNLLGLSHSKNDGKQGYPHPEF